MSKSLRLKSLLDALQRNGNLKAILLNNSPAFVNGTTFGERVAMLANAEDDKIVKAVLDGKDEELEMWRDPVGLRVLLVHMLNGPAMFDHLPKVKLGEATKRHVAFFVRVLNRRI